MQYEDWKYHHSRLPQLQGGDKAIYDAKLEMELLEEVAKAPESKLFLAGFSASSHESFLKSYAFWKRHMIQMASYWLEKIDRSTDVKCRKETQQAFDAILAKKLFNIELQWRANQLSIDCITTTWDFRYWYRHLEACPFIEPVTREEVRVLQRYLADENTTLDELTDISLLCPDFNEIMERDEYGLFDNMPDWFDYYDTYMGTGALLLLQDVRGEREEFYRGLYIKNKSAIEGVDRKTALPPAPGLPYLDSSSAKLYEFSKCVDDEIFQQLFRHFHERTAIREKAERDAAVYDIQSIIADLEEVPDPPPVRPGVNWRKAVYLCWQDHIKGVVSTDLPLLWEEKQLLRETGLRPFKTADESEGPKDELAALLEHQIREGRALAGEPRDFNF